MCPLYPNPWRKKAWGPFTAFRIGKLRPYEAAAGSASSAGASSVDSAAVGARGGVASASGVGDAVAMGTAGEVEGEALYLNSPAWRGVIGSGEYAHFDEWWGPFHYTRGWETMGDVLTRLAETAGSVIMSKVTLTLTLTLTLAETARLRDLVQGQAAPTRTLALTKAKLP